jgi:hypothetical protein
MRSISRDLSSVLLATVLAAPILLSGCQTQAPAPATAAAPADDPYVQWEHETHRDHVDIAKRTDDERKQYSDWHASHPDHR